MYPLYWASTGVRPSQEEEEEAEPCRRAWGFEWKQPSGLCWNLACGLPEVERG